MKKLSMVVLLGALLGCSSDISLLTQHEGKNFCMKMTTSVGDVDLLLNAEKAPISTQNFLSYANSGFYSGTVFHRVINDFMIQGGGFTADLIKKEKEKTIANEASNGLSNVRGSLAMARSTEPHSASCQFFINLKDNTYLDHTSETMQGWGYAVFGKVISGMDVVDTIAVVETGSQGDFPNVPVIPIVIQSVKRIHCPE